MNVLKKKINLEKYKIRFPKEEGSNWGETVKGFKIGEDNILYGLKDTLPLVEISGSTVLRYGTMIRHLTWLKTFIKESKLYTICWRNGNLKFVLNSSEISLEGLTNIKVYMADYLPTISRTWCVMIGGEWSEYNIYGEKVTSEDTGAVNCYKIETTDNIEYSAESSLFLKRKYFINPENALFLGLFSLNWDIDSRLSFIRANSFLNFAENKKTEIGTYTDYFDIPIYIEEEINDMGLFTSNVDFWIANKRYYLNDIVQDDSGNVWKLIKCEKNTIDKMLIPNVLNNFISEQLLNQSSIYKEYTNQDISEDRTHIYIYKEGVNFYYVRAYYKGFLDNIHWNYVGDNTQGKPIFNDDYNSDFYNGEGRINSITESKLKSLRRTKKSYDDDSNELPFIVSGDTAELIYSVNNYTNILEVDDKTYYDYIESITRRSEGSKNYIKFKYHIGAWKQGDEISEGVIYEEEYPYTMSQYTCKYDGVVKTFEYEKIEYTCQMNYVNMDLDKNKLYSKISVSRETLNSDDFQLVAYFKDENLMNIQKINKNIDIKIERGKSAAFERHQVLGEISSFDDLISYKNGFFTIKSD